MESLKDKVVLITGASSGIGAATAVLFAKYGCKVVVTGRDQERLNQTVEQCVSAGLEKNKIFAKTGDVTIDADLDKLMEATIETFGTLDILVNNAGMGIPGTVQEISMEEFDLVYRSDLRSVIYLTKLAIPHLKKNKGAIVNVSSIFSHRPCPAMFALTVAKAGLDMFAMNLALELAADGVRVNTVRPGNVRTRALDKAKGFDAEKAEQFWKHCEKINPSGRIATPEEIAQSIAFLASDASSFTTGAFLDVDGGSQHTAAWT